MLVNLFLGMSIVGILLFVVATLIMVVGLIARVIEMFFPKKAATEELYETSINYVPRLDRVIVIRAELPEQDLNAVLVPKSQQRDLNEGRVIAYGDGVSDLELDDVVCFLDYAGTPIVVDGVEYLSMRESEVHGRRPRLSKVIARG